MNDRFFTMIRDAWKSIAPDGFLGWQHNANRLLQISPPPLIDPASRMIVIFSPKSACSSVVIWYFHHAGLAKQALKHHRWPHQFRLEVYYKSSFYTEACNLDLTNFRVVRVVRDPLDRAVSSFRHVLSHGLADKLFAELLGRTDVAEAGVSFREFLDLLERVDLSTCNEHFGIQRHPIEDKLPVTHLINISTENLFTRLNEVEADLAMPITNFDKLDWIHTLDIKRSRFKSNKLETDDAYDLRLTRAQAANGPWPPYNALLTPLAEKRLASLYATDIAAYGKSAPRPGRVNGAAQTQHLP